MRENRPAIWYPIGAGGHWLNYLIWCNFYKKNLPFGLNAFRPRDLTNIFNDYCVFIDFNNPHNDTVTGDILLGSNRAWYNFYLYNLTKNGMVGDDNLYKGACVNLNLWKKNIQFNLEWTLIWTDPEKFLKDLNSFKNINLSYGSYSEIAFAQYRKSCLLPDIKNNEFRSSNVFKYWHKAIFDTQTDTNFSNQQRIDQAEFILEQLYWPGYKK